jgi:hypothetical protein
VTELDSDTQRLIAEAAEWIVEYHYDIRWHSVSRRFGLGDHVAGYERLTRSQSFHDADYPDCVLAVLIDMWADNPEDTCRLLMRVVQHDVADLVDEYPALASLKEHGTPGAARAVALPSSVRYLEIDFPPDDFYKDLVAEVNNCYRYGMYVPMRILIRKLFENLVIDVLRKKYKGGKQDVELYFATARGRFHDFAVLCDNLDGRQADFTSIVSGLDSVFFTKLRPFRVRGNSGAHTIELGVVKADVDAERPDANHVAKLLVRAFQNIP